MAFNEDTSFIEYPVDQPTQDFVTNFDTIGGTTDVVLVTVDGVLTDTPESSYTVQQTNHTTWRVTPEVQAGSVVRLYRVTNIDEMMHVFTAGAKFIARNMDSNFKQIRHAQQEVRDGFNKLAEDTYAVIDGLDAAIELAQDAAQDAQDAAAIAQDAANTVNAIIVDGKVIADKVLDASGKTQQEVNNDQEVLNNNQVFKDNQAYQPWVSKAGGWAINDTVRLTNGDIVINTIAGNTANPNTNRTGWVSFGNSNIVFHGDVLYPEYSPFSNMTVNGIPINRKYRMRNYVAERPSDFTWDAHGFKFWLDSDGILRSNIKPDDYDVASKAVDKVEYFIRKGGSALPANTGTDPNDPQGSLTQILTNINAGNIQNAVIWIKPDVFTDGTVWGVGETVRVNKNISIKPWNNSVTAPYLDTTDNPIVITTENLGLTWALVSTGVYSTTRPAANAIVDEGILNDLYDWSMYTKVDSLALCTSTAGSWFQDGTTLYVHTLDNRIPDAKLHVYVQKDNAYFLGGDYTAYLERVWLYGGTAPCYGTTDLTNTTETIFLNKCRFRYAVNNGMSFFGMKYCIAYECESSYNGSDGYNYHADTTLVKKTQNVEFKCIAYRNGHAWSPVEGVNNGSTTHDGCDIVRAGTVVFENQGPNIADVNGGNSWLFDCIARNSLNPRGGAVNCDFYSSQNKMWLDHCDASGSNYSASAVGSGVKIYVRNCNLYARLSQAANFQWWSTAKFDY